MDLHQEIRRIAMDRHVRPAVVARRDEFSIAVRDLMAEAAAEGISTQQRAPAFCRSIQTRRFLDENGLTITKVDGPRSGLSTTVVVHYKVARNTAPATAPATDSGKEERKRRALEAFDQLRGLMKDEIAAHGGAEAFIRWVRSDQDEDAA
jgi:hypothetical protein